MNASQVSGITKNIVGKFQERAGKLIGSKEQQITGRQKQSKGNAEKNLGDARELIKNAIKQMQRSKQAMQYHTTATLFTIRKNKKHAADTNKPGRLQSVN